MNRKNDSTAFVELDDATSRILRTQIETKFGAKITSCGNAQDLREAIRQHTRQLLSISSLRRFFGLVDYAGKKMRTTTLDLYASYLGYESFSAWYDVIKSGVVEGPMLTLQASNIEMGSQIKVSFIKGLEALMCYIGEDRFIINSSTMPLIAKGEIVHTPQISVGMHLTGMVNGEMREATSELALVTAITIVL